MSNDAREAHYLHPGRGRAARNVLTPRQLRRMRQHPSQTTGSTDPPSEARSPRAAASSAASG